MIEEQKHQVMPTTTQAVRPPTEKTVLAKKSGRGMRIIRTRVCWLCCEYQNDRRKVAKMWVRTKPKLLHAANLNAFFNPSRSRSFSSVMPSTGTSATCTPPTLFLSAFFSSPNVFSLADNELSSASDLDAGLAWRCVDIELMVRVLSKSKFSGF